MPRFYTVDRLNSLEKNKIINLTQYNDINSPLQEHVDFLLPEGVSVHGNTYFLKRPDISRGTSYFIEIVFEYVRRAYFPDKPSRFQSVFAFETLEQAKDFKKTFCEPADSIWVVECKSAFKADMKLLNLGESPLVLSFFAHQYWLGEPRGQVPFWEYLLTPPVLVLNQVE